MGDSKDKNVPIDFGDIDWDSALEEWDKNAFSPEIAPDAESSKAAVASGADAKEAAVAAGPKADAKEAAVAASPKADAKEAVFAAPAAEAHRALPSDMRAPAEPPRAPLVPPKPLPLPLPPSSRALPRPADLRKPNLPPRIAARPAAPPSAPASAPKPSGPLLPSLSVLELDDASASAKMPAALPAVDLELDDDDAAGAESARPVSIEIDDDVAPNASGAASPPSTRDRSRTPSKAADALLDAPPMMDLPSDATDPAGLRARAEWLAEEALAEADPARRARALLAVSELFALAGDVDRARTHAVEAHALRSDHPLAARQARQLAATTPDALAAALDEEAANAPTAAARAHAALLGADVLRRNGKGAAAAERWARARAFDPKDVRPATAQAANALGTDEPSSVDPSTLDAPELVALRRAFTEAVRERSDAPDESADPGDLGVALTDTLRGVRKSLTTRAPEAAARAAGRLAAFDDATFSEAALWLASAFGAATDAERRRAADAAKALVARGHRSASRHLAARGLELSDPALVEGALADDAPFSPSERAVIAKLAGLGEAEASHALRDAGDAFEPLLRALGEAAARLAGTSPHADGDDVHARDELGRLLAGRPTAEALDAALAELPYVVDPSLSGVLLEHAARRERWGDVGRAIAALAKEDDATARFARALISERAGDPREAAHAWASALEGAPSTAARVAALRALADAEPSTDVAAELAALARATDATTDDPHVKATTTDDAATAVLHLELFARAAATVDRTFVLEALERGLGGTGLPAFVAEDEARKRGATDEARRWIERRRATAQDPLERAVEALREANLTNDPSAREALVEEALAARPNDVALRERLALFGHTSPADDAAFLEARAGHEDGAGRAALLLESAFGYLGAGDPEAALRVAKAAEAAGETAGAPLVRERAELALGRVTERMETLVAAAKNARDDDERRDVHERLASIDPDPAGALRWHRAILSDSPRALRSLRFVEDALVTEGRDDELAPIFAAVAEALEPVGDGEFHAHVALAAHLARKRPSSAAEIDTRGLVRRAALAEAPSLWALRTANARARLDRDDVAVLATSRELAERTSRGAEKAHLLAVASEAARRAGNPDEARALLERAVTEAPDDVVAWEAIAAIHEANGDRRALAEARAGVARTSAVPSRKLDAAYGAALLWLEEGDVARATAAFEACADVDVRHRETFEHLSKLYAEQRRDADRARLVERRLEHVVDRVERVTLEVELARMLIDIGDRARAKKTLEAALRDVPDHPTALSAMAELCTQAGDWVGAEQSYVRLARLLPSAAEQRTVYETLGDIYALHLDQPARAQIAFKEVLKRAPDDVATIEKLIDVCRKQGDAAQAALLQQELLNVSPPEDRLRRLVELAQIHELGRDLRRAEQIFETARREHPASVPALRAISEFYARQHQMPAMQILLDRTAADVRRAFASGRFDASLFELLQAALELRGRTNAAQLVQATLAAVMGHGEPIGPVALRGAEARAMDPRLDDVLAPDVAGEALRALLARTGDALDAAAPVDLRAVRATPLTPGTPLGRTVGAIATIVGLGALQILVSPKLGRVAVPLSSATSTLLVGEPLTTDPNERARAFVVVRALKLIVVRASALARGEPTEADALAAALFSTLKAPPPAAGGDPKRVAELSKKIASALPRRLDPTVGTLALEAAGTLAASGASLRQVVTHWANRAALLAVGDPAAALEAMAWLHGRDGLPSLAGERAAFLAETPEARELVTFAVSEAYAEARARLGLDR